MRALRQEACQHVPLHACHSFQSTTYVVLVVSLCFSRRPAPLLPEFRARAVVVLGGRVHAPCFSSSPRRIQQPGRFSAFGAVPGSRQFEHVAEPRLERARPSPATPGFDSSPCGRRTRRAAARVLAASASRTRPDPMASSSPPPPLRVYTIRRVDAGATVKSVHWFRLVSRRVSGWGTTSRAWNSRRCRALGRSLQVRADAGVGRRTWPRKSGCSRMRGAPSLSRTWRSR